MNHTDIIGRAWRMTRSYRALWIFGVVLALVTYSWTPWALLDREDGREWEGISVTALPGETFWQTFRRAVGLASREANLALSEVLAETLGIHMRVNVWAILAATVVLIILLIAAKRVARYVSETALIRMVGTFQETGERPTFRQGFRLGWSRTAWRFFLIDLLVDAVAVVASLALFVVILGPLPLWVDGSEGVIFTFAFLTGGLVLAAMAVVIVGAAAASAVKRLAMRACALEDLSVTEALRRGWASVQGHLHDASLMWLVATGIRLTWAFVSAPVVFVLIGAALILGGLPGIVAGGLTGLFATEELAVVVGLALGVPLFVLIFVAPLVLLSGLLEVFVSTLWTLTYRALLDVGSAALRPAPGLSPSGLTAAPAD